MRRQILAGAILEANKPIDYLFIDDPAQPPDKQAEFFVELRVLRSFMRDDILSETRFALGMGPWLCRRGQVVSFLKCLDLAVAIRLL
jgi:hypothetical protein